MVPAAPAAKKSSLLFTPRDSCWLGKRVSNLPNYLNLGLVLRTLPHKKRCSIHPNESYKTTTPVSAYRAARETKWSKARHKRRDRKRLRSGRKLLSVWGARTLKNKISSTGDLLIWCFRAVHWGRSSTGFVVASLFQQHLKETKSCF